LCSYSTVYVSWAYCLFEGDFALAKDSYYFYTDKYKIAVNKSKPKTLIVSKIYNNIQSNCTLCKFICKIDDHLGVFRNYDYSSPAFITELPIAADPKITDNQIDKLLLLL
jgi:hypothetical protein